MKLKPTISDVLDAISTFAENVDERFDRLEKRVTKVESQMVTKDYLDDKIADVKGSLVSVIRKEDERVTKLVKTLSDKKVISKSETFEIMQLKPFP